MRKKISGIIIILICLIALIAISVTVILVSDDVQKDMFPNDYKEAVSKYAEEYGIDENLINAVIWVESSFRSDAVSRTGARGLMQITKGTLPDINEMLNENYTFDDMFIPEINIRCGVCYLNYLFKRFGNEELVFAAYNGGPTNVANWLLDERYSKDGKLTDIPIPETKRYVSKVVLCYQKYTELYGNHN